MDSFIKKLLIMEANTIVHSHTFEHIYNPHEFLEEISSVLMGGGQDDIFTTKYGKMA